MNAFVQTILCILISSVLYAQDLAGQWNGTLNIQGNQLRIVFHVTKTNGQYEVTLDSPDQNVSGIKVSVTNFNYPNVKFEISAVGAFYEGVISDDSITGKWVQAGTSLFLVLLKAADTPKEKER